MDLSKLSNEELLALKARKQTYAEPTLLDKAAQSATRLGKSAIEALPFGGALVGGTLGTVGGPVGTVAGAGLGAGAGKSLENLLENYFLDEEKTRAQIYGDPALEALIGASGEAGGAMLAKGIASGLKIPLPFKEKPLNIPGLQQMGEGFYKKAFTPIDQAAELKSKELMPSDIFFREGFTGSGREAGEFAGGLVEREMGKVTDILKQADEAAKARGIYADPQKMYSPLLKSAKELKATPHTTFQDIGKTLEEYAQPQIQQMSSREGFPGLLPSEVAGLKSKLYKQVPAGRWGEFAQTPAGKDALKLEAQGYKAETERLADMLVPHFAGDVRKANEVAGTLLTTEQALLKEAMKQERAPLMTEVTGSLAGGAYANPSVLPFLLGKESVRAAKFMSPRTKAGMGAYKAGKAVEEGALDPVLKAILINQMQGE